MYLLRLLLLAAALTAAPVRAALDPALVAKLASEDSEEKIAAMTALGLTGEPLALRVLKALGEDALFVGAQGRPFLREGEHALDAATGAEIASAPENAEPVSINNRVRRELLGILAGLRLLAPERAARLAAVSELEDTADETMLPLLTSALEKETDPEIRRRLILAHAHASLASADPAARLAAVKSLGESGSPNIRTLLAGRLEKKGEDYAEPDPAVRSQAAISLRAVESRLTVADYLGRVFSGLSLGSILLLAALGLAITYGVMGVINMAHGELLMVGAYATYAVQGLFRAHLPGALDWYVVAAIPVAFFSSALVGAVMERTVIRFLYGRPLETLLATWGISLILIQAARVLFGAQNVEVANPAWMSGGVELLPNLILPWNRIVIIGFSVGVVGLVWALLNLTRLGMYVRAVTQNRPMAGCVGVPTGRVDTLAFAIGAGIAGLGGCALSQIANVGPDMGQGYIVDSFMVVVLGGVGQLAGAVWAALGLGVVSKFLEGWTGAVIAKIVVLVFIIVFIQKRPQGLFALKGRTVES
jgi:urea transport system permease protein